MPAKRSAAPRRSRSRYTPPTASEVQENTIGHLVGDLRSLTQNGQQNLILAERMVWFAGHRALLDRPSVAIVGTRDASDAGRLRARKLARELVQRNYVIVSGLAKGIDTEALQSALEAGGHVIGVIGTPIEKAYPIENAELQERIAKDHLLISPFAPGTRTFPGHFPERNRVMAAISDATAIMEASDTSGTLHQAAECVRLDRWLFIAKNVMDDQTLAWPKRFMSYNRTRTLTSTDDIDTALRES